VEQGKPASLPRSCSDGNSHERLKRSTDPACGAYGFRATIDKTNKTMIEQPLSSLDAWVAYFEQATIPVLRHTVQELELLQTDAERVNARVLSGVILHDPLMTLRVLAYIEQRRKQRQTTDITTIERALMMIGMNPFFRDFQDLPLIEDMLKEHPKALLGLLRTINRAGRSAHWARDWAILRHDLDVDEITVATLLYDIAEILMWIFAPSLALQVLKVQQENRSRRSALIQEEIYGVPLFELKSALIKAWHLPELLGTLVDVRNDGNPRVRNVKLAVDLARHSANGWDDAALPDDYRGIRELLHISQPTLIRRLGLDDDATAAMLIDAAEKEDAADAIRNSASPESSAPDPAVGKP